jgi:hypothetical protein
VYLVPESRAALVHQVWTIKEVENLLAGGHRAKEIKRRKFGRRHSPLCALTTQPEYVHI